MCIHVYNTITPTSRRNTSFSRGRYRVSERGGEGGGVGYCYVFLFFLNKFLGPPKGGVLTPRTTPPPLDPPLFFSDSMTAVLIVRPKKWTSKCSIVRPTQCLEFPRPKGQKAKCLPYLTWAKRPCLAVRTFSSQTIRS